MFDYPTIRFIWWLLVGVLLIGFAIMDGHDMGVGALLPFVGRNDTERRVVINTIAPHWDGNQVWFITAGGAIFAAWPFVYATAFSGFYWAMLAVLWSLFFRPVGFDYRSKIEAPRWRAFWDWGLFVGGFVPPVIFGVAFGNLQVKGSWVLSRYFKRELDGCHTEDGWFNTGDVVTIDRDGYMKITDRTKDVIKSGGEWISSIELENILVGHPAVAEAAAIGVVHPKWDERPLMVVVLKPGASATREELIGFYEGKIAKWWTPDDVVFLDELPHTATGKLQKMKLRELFKDYQWG